MAVEKRRLGWRAGGQDYYEPMRYLDDGRKAIALTIDDGPSPVYTRSIPRRFCACRRSTA